MIARRVFEKASELQSEHESLSDPELERTLLQLCDAARKDGNSAEGLIVQLKRSWAAIPSGVESHDRNELIAQLVSLCIREFYRDGESKD